MKKLKRRNINIKLGEENNSRNIILKAFMLLVFLLMGLRIFYLQVLMGDKYSYLSQRNRIKIKEIEAPRGKIYDSKGRLIVTNGSGYRLVYLQERKQTPEVLKEISEITGYSEDYISKRIKYGEIFPYTRENVIIDDLKPEIAHKLIEQLIDYPYLQVQTYSKRRYLFDDVAAHSIGYVKKISEKEYEKLKDEGYGPRDIIGKDGLENRYDRELQGEDGYEYIEVNALNKLQRKIEEKKNPIPGKDMHITLDMELQEYMEKQYEALTDEELIEKLRAGESGVMDFLLEKYKYLVRKKANAVFLLGGDTDDLVQEGMIGLFKAVRDFDRSQGSFYYFADLCIGRQIYHAIEAASRKKHGPLNSYISLSEDASDTSGVPLAESISWREDNPEQILIERENVEQFLEEIRSNLSPLEQKVLTDYLDGMNYRQIAEKWNKPEKSIDNALQRIKSKVQKLRSCK